MFIEVICLLLAQIADGLKTRFKYTTVPAADYGLSVVDILEKDEKDLNQVVPLKKLQP